MFLQTEFIQKILSGLKRFPLLALWCLIFYVFSLCFVWDLKGIHEYSSYLYIFPLLIPLIGAAHLNHESLKRQPLLYYIVPSLILLFSSLYFLITEHKGGPLTRFILLFLISHLLISFLPVLKRSSHEFWQYNKNHFTQFLLSSVSSSVLAAGFSLALYACSKLLGMPLNTKTQSSIALFFFLIFHPIHFYASITALDKLSESKKDALNGLRTFAQYILAPVVISYLVILTLYFFKIIFTQELPSGVLSFLVLVVSILGILNLLLLEPFLQKAQKNWLHLYRKIFFILSIMNAGMMLYAICLRIGQYNLTVDRYFVLALAIWIAGVSFYFLLSKKKKIIVIPASLMFFCCFAFYMPFFNAYSSSYKSQLTALKKIIQIEDLTQKERIQKNTKELDITYKAQVQDIIAYLVELSPHKKIIREFNLLEKNISYYELHGKLLKHMGLPLKNLQMGKLRSQGRCQNWSQKNTRLNTENIKEISTEKTYFMPYSYSGSKFCTHTNEKTLYLDTKNYGIDCIENKFYLFHDKNEKIEIPLLKITNTYLSQKENKKQKKMAYNKSPVIDPVRIPGTNIAVYLLSAELCHKNIRSALVAWGTFKD